MKALLLYYNTDNIGLGQCKSDTLRNLYVEAIFKVSKKYLNVIATITIFKIVATNMIHPRLFSSQANDMPIIPL